MTGSVIKVDVILVVMVFAESSNAQECAARTPRSSTRVCVETGAARSSEHRRRSRSRIVDGAGMMQTE